MAAYSAKTGRRYIEPVNGRSRVRCACCGNRATHLLMADGAAMGTGCELYGRRWVKNYGSALNSLSRLRAAAGRAALERSEGSPVHKPAVDSGESGDE